MRDVLSKGFVFGITTLSIECINAQHDDGPPLLDIIPLQDGGELS